MEFKVAKRQTEKMKLGKMMWPGREPRVQGDPGETGAILVMQTRHKPGGKDMVSTDRGQRNMTLWTLAMERQRRHEETEIWIPGKKVTRIASG